MKYTRERHALGFMKFTLAFGSGRRIRLHVWEKTLAPERQHSHDWPFISIPLVGTFTETRWHVTRGAGQSVRGQWSNQQDADDAPVDTGSRDALTPVSTRTRWPLLPYYCPRDAVHTLRPRSPARLHVSLVFAGRPRTGTSETWTKLT